MSVALPVISTRWFDGVNADSGADDEPTTSDEI